MLATLPLGCSRWQYREWADRDALALISSREADPAVAIPLRPVEPDQLSRMADFIDPDCPTARPVDDAIAAAYMDCSYVFGGSTYWDKIGEGAPIDWGQWYDALPMDENGQLVIDRRRAIELALLHNRQYQTEYEGLYLNALSLALTRYDYHTRWFGGSGVNFSASGDGALASRLLSDSNRLGYRRNLVSGGQFLTNFANSFVWQLGGGTHTNSVASNLVFALTQPLLRGAWRHVGLESLTQAERSLLYAAREFVRFRRRFYLDITRSYLQLLTSAQSLRNQRLNIESLELNLLEHQELQRLGAVAPIQVDQVLLSYQSGQISLLGQEQSLQDALDNFKFTLGLPPEVPIEIDDSILKPFELTDPRLDEAQKTAQRMFTSLVQYLPPDETPPDELIAQSYEGVLEQFELLQDLVPEIESEMQRWKAQLDATAPEQLDDYTRLDFETQQRLYDRLAQTLEELKTELPIDAAEAVRLSDLRGGKSPEENWNTLKDLIGDKLRAHVSTLFIVQNQVRLFLIQLTPFEIAMDDAVQQAVASRLDLMNQRAAVTDSFRQVELAANRLKSDLSVSATANLATDPTKKNPIRFDSSAASYQVSAQFDGPLDRYAERNAYRAAQIAYQQQRRQYMAAEDSIRNEIRSSIRQINLSRLNFQIARQQLITATRQVEDAQLRLRQSQDANSSLTRDLLGALQGLLDARNSLISSWISYEVSRISLFVQMEMLELDEEGNWINERYNPSDDRNAPVNDDVERRESIDSAQPPLPDGSVEATSDGS